MEFDEQDIFGFPVTLNAPGPLRGTEKNVESALAWFPEPCTGLRIHAPGLNRTTLDSALMIFSLRYAQALDLGSAAPRRSSNTRH